MNRTHNFNTVIAVILAMIIAILLYVVIHRIDDVEIDTVHAEELDAEIPTVIFPQLDIPVEDVPALDILLSAAPSSVELIPQFPLTPSYFEEVAEMSKDMADMDVELLAVNVNSNYNQPAEEPTMTYLGSYRCTGYDICVACCGKTDGITASGTYATPGRTVAINGLPFGTQLYIEGIGYRTVEDRGGMPNGVIDVLCNNHTECYAITGTYNVYLVG